MSNCLEVQKLSKHYRDFSLQNVSFNLPKGYIMGLIGPNGAGKTTTIRAILELIKIDDGEIYLFGENIKTSSVVIRNEIGVVMDESFFSEEWKVKEVEKVLKPFYQNWDSSHFAKLLKDFNINSDKRVKELSRGMKVKLMLAVALAHHAKLLILDEPTSGLDPVARAELMSILSDFIADEDNSVLFSTHITSDLEKIADYITFIRNGKIELTKEKDELLESYVIVKGDDSTLTESQKKQILGYQESEVGFKGLIKVEELKELPKEVITEKITLDELIVYMSKEGLDYE